MADTANQTSGCREGLAFRAGFNLGLTVGALFGFFLARVMM